MGGKFTAGVGGQNVGRDAASGQEGQEEGAVVDAVGAGLEDLPVLGAGASSAFGFASFGAVDLFGNGPGEGQEGVVVPAYVGWQLVVVRERGVVAGWE